MLTYSRLLVVLVHCALLGLVGFGPASAPTARFVSCVVAPRRQRLQLFYQDDHGRRFGSIGRLRAWLAARHQTLVFALNGGMYAPGGVPKGLFIERQKLVTPLDTTSGAGNFYVKPNGVFYLTTSQEAGICATGQFRASQHIAYATQSGPLLVVDGQLNPVFTQGSANLVVRNGVGLLPGGKLLFAMSSAPVNFYDFAVYFQRLGCTQALYLDGFVSRLYLPEKHWQQTDGDFGVIMAVTTPAKP